MRLSSSVGLVHLTGDSLADSFESRKVPAIGEIAALLGLDRLDGAIITFQENTFTIWIFLEGQSPAIGAEPGKGLNEFELTQAFKLSQTRDLCVG